MTEFLDGVTELGPELAVRATVLFGVACGLAWCLRSGSAAQRHLVWGAALAGSLVLPVMHVTVPEWRVWPGPVVEQVDATASADSAILVGWAETAPVPVGVTPSDLRVGSTTVVRQEAVSAGIPVGHWLVAVWGAGVLCGVARLGLGMFRLRRLARQAEPVTGEVESLLCESARGLGIRRAVRGWVSREPVVPMTWGWLRPVVLLPAEAEGWEVERLRVVLLHELAHVRRGDYVTQFVGEVARSVYWFHPLAWWSARRMRAEQEAACDDCVLSSGTTAEDYAEELIAVTARLPRGMRGAGVALAMGRANRIEARVRSILTSDLDRRPVGKWRLGVFTGMFGTLATLAAIVGPAAIAKDAPAPSTTKPAVEAKPANTPAAPEAEQAGALRRLADSDEGLRQVLDQIEAQAVQSPERNKLREGAIRGMIQALQDPYSELINEQEIGRLHEMVNGQLVGIGLVVTGDKSRKLVEVRTTMPGSPAQRAGFLPGERIVAVDGQPIETVEESARAIRGPAGTEVTVTILGKGGNERKLTAKREAITVPTVRGLAWEKTDNGGSWRHWLDADAKLAYVAVLSFGPKTGTDLRAILERLHAEGLKGLVLDLRGNPGGLLNTCVEVAQLFLSNAEVVRIVGKEPQPIEVLKVTGDAPFGKVPLVVVVDQSTGSAAEVLAGALQDNKRGVILGERTHGKGSIQAILPLGQESIKLTVRLMTTPAGRAFNRTPDATVWGIDPDPGFFVPTDPEAHQMRVVKVIRAENGLDKLPEPLSAEALAKDLSDKALSLALAAMKRRLETGDFEPNGQSLEEQEVLLKQREALRAERDALRVRLGQLDQALGGQP